MFYIPSNAEYWQTLWGITVESICLKVSVCGPESDVSYIKLIVSILNGFTRVSILSHAWPNSMKTLISGTHIVTNIR